MTRRPVTSNCAAVSSLSVTSSDAVMSGGQSKSRHLKPDKFSKFRGNTNRNDALRPQKDHFYGRSSQERLPEYRIEHIGEAVAAQEEAFFKHRGEVIYELI